ncbi:MAG: TVP38/TMEM64 family protein [Caulobacteraceae bacterium]|nr:TVP38/TMEM64 family protein [Caulobacteraceae bacterium]
MSEPAPPKAGAWAMARRFGPLALVAAGLVAAFAMGLPHELTFHQLHRHKDQLESLARLHPVLSVAAYVGVYALAVAFSLPVAMVMTLTGGLLFGPWVGGLAAACGCTIGGTGVFLVCRTAAGDVLRRRAGATIARIEDGVLRDAFSYILVLRLLPVMPFWLANLALGFIEIPLRTFVTATFLGILPISLVYADLGSDLGRMFARGARPDLHAVFRPEVLAALAGLALLSLAPVLVRQLRRRRG